MSQTESAVIPDNFKKVIVDFISSFITTFPEYKDGIYKVLDMQEYSDVEFVHSRPGSARPTDECINNMSDANVHILFEHCKRVYPERFFDILYQNDMIFSPESAVSNDVCVDFLPNVDFRLVWNLSDISDATKDHLWKHMQLITFTILGSISRDNLSFGDTARLFEAIDENELRAKLEETMSGIHSLFESEATAAGNAGANTEGGEHTSNSDGQHAEPESDASSSSSSFLPNADSIHEQLSGLLDGKIGALAKEIAEETVSELGIDVSNESSVTGVFQKLMKNPGKLSGIIKKVGEKLDKKMKSGDIKESELFKEASDFMSKMKSGKGGKGGGGMADFAQIFKAMNLNPADLGGAAAGLSGKTKVNLNAMQAQMGRNMKMALAKERMHKKLDERRTADAAAAAPMQHSVYQPANAPKNEKTMRVPMSAPATDNAAAATAATSSAEATAATDAKLTGYEPVDSSQGSKHKKHKKK
jgi:hypothetical protein